MTLFRDRVEAGRILAERLLTLHPAQPIVLALPRGGVPVGFEVAKALQAPLDVVIVRKIGAPDQPELAVGAVVDGGRPELFVNEGIRRDLDLSDEWLQQAMQRQLSEIERRHALYRGRRAQAPIAGRTAIVVDDGIATGATVRAALLAIRRAGPTRLVLAVPVAPPDMAESLREEVDDLVCLAMPEPFSAIGAFYQDFGQTSDEEVIALLAKAAKWGDAGNPATGKSAET